MKIRLGARSFGSKIPLSLSLDDKKVTNTLTVVEANAVIFLGNCSNRPELVIANRLLTCILEGKLPRDAVTAANTAESGLGPSFKIDLADPQCSLEAILGLHVLLAEALGLLSGIQQSPWTTESAEAADRIEEILKQIHNAFHCLTESDYPIRG